MHHPRSTQDPAPPQQHVSNAIGRSQSYAVRQWRFSAEQSAWVMLTAQQVEREAGNVVKSSLKLFTYNVWFDTYARCARIREILSMLPELEPDVVCIQEATDEWIHEMISNDYVRRNYTVSDVDGRTLRGYGVVLLSRLPMSKLSMWWLPSNMGRSALIASLTINNETVSVGTVHLESLDQAPYREKQLEIIAGALGSSAHAALMGDFNFDSERNWSNTGPLENDNLKRLYPDYVDVWAELHPDLRGLTFDTETNRMLGGREQARYDRVMWKSDAGKWRPKSIQMLGTQPLRGLKTVWPSDHYGLFAELDFSPTQHNADQV